MTSVCISSCVNDARVPVRATYVNLYKWPESDAEFIRSMSANMRAAAAANGRCLPHPRVVDSISCRQLYLRSYTFSRDDDDSKKEEENGRKKRRRRRRRKSHRSGSDGGRGGERRQRKKCSGLVASIFRRLLSCTTKVDVVG